MFHYRLDLEYDLRKNYDGCRPNKASSQHKNTFSVSPMLGTAQKAWQHMLDTIDEWRQDLTAGSGGLQVNF